MYVDIVRSVLIDSFSLVHVISYAAISNQVLIVTSLILALFDMDSFQGHAGYIAQRASDMKTYVDETLV